MTVTIHTEAGRARLAARAAPYYVRRAKGLYLGVRIAKKGMSWCGRFQPPHGGAPAFDTFGDVASMTHDQAAAACDAWGQAQRTGRPIPNGARTVADIVHAYLDDLRDEGREDAATNGEKMMRQHLLGGDPNRRTPPKRPRRAGVEARPVHPVNALALRPAGDVGESELKKWRKGICGYKGKPLAVTSVDRVIGVLIAALNFGVRKRLITGDRVIEWEEGLTKSGKSNSRKLVLEPKQIRALIAACDEPEFANLVEAIAVTGARYGEMRNATAQDYDTRRRTLRLCGKTGERVFAVTDEAAAVFKRLVKNSLPNAPLVMAPGGGHWKPGKQKTPMKKAATKAGMPKGTILYTLRHSWITHALSGDSLPLMTVADAVGTSIKMIQKHYGHANEAQNIAMRRKKIVG